MTEQSKPTEPKLCAVSGARCLRPCSCAAHARAAMQVEVRRRLSEMDRVREKLNEDASYVVQRLLFVLHIYGGHPISTRGPTGCLHDAIRCLDPATYAKIVVDGADYGDLLDNGGEEPSHAETGETTAALEGALDERRAVLTWLRWHAEHRPAPTAQRIREVADDIERGEHLRCERLAEPLPDVPPDSVRCTGESKWGRCQLVSDHTGHHTVSVTWRDEP